MKLGTWLLALMQPLLAKILASVGFSVVTMVGLDAIFTQLKGSLTSGIGGLPADALAMFLLAGGGQALGIVLCAITTKLMMWQIQKATQILGANPS